MTPFQIALYIVAPVVFVTGISTFAITLALQVIRDELIARRAHGALSILDDESFLYAESNFPKREG